MHRSTATPSANAAPAQKNPHEQKGDASVFFFLTRPLEPTAVSMKPGELGASSAKTFFDKNKWRSACRKLAKSGTASRISQALPTALSNGQNPLGMSNTDAMKQLRGPKHENWPVCDPRAAPPGEHGLQSGKNGHCERSMAHIAHQPGPVCLEGGVSRWLVGAVGLGSGAAPAPTRGAWGASSIRVA
jgi:hypothetical protein